MIARCRGPGLSATLDVVFTDAPALFLVADLRHRELLADADRFRLARLATGARHRSRTARLRALVRRVSVAVPAAQRTGGGIVDADRRWPVPR